MFGQIGNMKYILILLVISVICSCIGKSSKNCEWEKKNYEEKWDFVVAKTYKSPNYKATYIIETTFGKKNFFQPKQDLVSSTEPGDKIMKQANSKYAYWINSNNDTIRSRIFSISCDSIVENW
jgi:hypothetical protein